MRERDLGPKSLWCVYVVLVAESLCTRVGEPSLTRGRRRTVRRVFLRRGEGRSKKVRPRWEAPTLPFIRQGE
jgi:hypothetical protein